MDFLAEHRATFKNRTSREAQSAVGKFKGASHASKHVRMQPTEFLDSAALAAKERLR